ncbi:MAG: DUF3284 domain-containing protein [Clostridia bacterium]
MIQVVKELNVNIDDFYDFIEKSVKEDIKNATNEEVLELTEGFSYEKKLQNSLKQSGSVLALIEKYERKVCYKSKITSNQGYNYVSFETEEIDDENIKLTYTEHFDSDKSTNNLNYKFMLFFYKKSLARRMTLTIENMETKIKKGDEICQD